MPLFEVFIPSTDPDGFNITARIRAASWIQALRNGLSKLGDTADVQNILCDITEVGIDVTEPRSGRVFRIREIPEEQAAARATPPGGPVVAPLAAAPAAAGALRAPAGPPPAVGAAPPPPPAMSAAPPPAMSAAPPPAVRAAPPPAVRAAPPPAVSAAPPSAVSAAPTSAVSAAPTSAVSAAPTPAAMGLPPAAARRAPPPVAVAPAVAAESRPAAPAGVAPAAAQAARQAAVTSGATIPAATRPARFASGPDVEEEGITREKASAAPAVQIGRAREEESTEELLADLFDATQGIYEQPDLGAAAGFILDLAMRTVPSESGAVFISDINRHDLYFASARGPKAGEVMAFRVPMGQGIVGFSAQEGVALAVSDVHRDPRFYATISKALGYETRSILCAPAQQAGRVFGALELINRRNGSSYTNQEVDVLNYLAHQLADYLINTGQTGD